MSERKQAITMVWNEFIKVFMPKLDRLSAPAEKVVCARLLKATLEDFIEKNS